LQELIAEETSVSFDGITVEGEYVNVYVSPRNVKRSDLEKEE